VAIKTDEPLCLRFLRAACRSPFSHPVLSFPLFKPNIDIH
jgi:hypothetical protein